MKTRNLIYSLIAIVALVVVLSSQNISPSHAQGTLLYDGFDSPPLNTSLWDSSNSNWTAHVEVSGGSLIIYSGTVEGGGGTVLSNQT